MICETLIWRQGEYIPCRQSSGIRQWWDASGNIHTACRYHVAERLHRYPAFDPPEPDWYTGMDHPADASWTDAYDPIDLAKWEADRMSWTA